MLSFETLVKIHKLANQQEAVAYAVDQMKIPTTTTNQMEVVMVLLGEAARAEAETLRLVLSEIDFEVTPKKKPFWKR